jgi:hypothetical protein
MAPLSFVSVQRRFLLGICCNVISFSNQSASGVPSLCRRLAADGQSVIGCP